MRTAPDLILHIGHYKTGTTALQVFMAQNRAVMARAGLSYAQTAVKNAKHSRLAFALLREAGVTSLMYGYDDPRSAREIWRTLFEELRALPRNQSLLVSSEEFMRLGAHPAAAAVLRDILADQPDIRLRVIAYLRPPQEHLRSWYNQMIKLGHPVAGFDAAMRTQFEPIHRDYALALAPWIELAGPDAVILRGFDHRLRQGGALFRDFLTALGFELPPRAVLPDGDPNPRLDDRLLPLRRALNATSLPRKTQDRVLRQAEEALAALDGDDAAAAGADGLAAILATARAGIERLARLPHAGFDAARLMDDLPAPEDPSEAGAAALAAILAAELAQMQQAQRRTNARLSALEKTLGLAGPRADTESGGT